MREPLFKAYVAMMPRLEAEEALADISQISAGSATMAKIDRVRYVSDLRSHLPKPKAVKPTLRQLSQMGIKVVVTEPKASDD